jgi:demethylmenaquinone methyltransferase/2-methoxy-6-polyprenyl-1,4-benzoquinol methylase
MTPDPVEVNSMFARIARRYDVANRLLSGGCDRGWRRRLVAAVRAVEPARVLDLATGSGDVALALGAALPRSVRIVGMDFCLPMLAEAEKKRLADGPGAHPNIEFQPGDGLALPIPDSSFDAVTIAFGLRNMADRARSLAEMRRALRPGGRLFILEFSRPRPWLRPLYFFYLRRVLPALAGWVTRERSAYEYLNASIEAFPDRPALAAEIRAAGFSSVAATALTGGIVALHEAVR